MVRQGGFAAPTGMKRHYGFTQVRCISLARNACVMHLMCAANNLRHALILAA